VDLEKLKTELLPFKKLKWIESYRIEVTEFEVQNYLHSKLYYRLSKFFAMSQEKSVECENEGGKSGQYRTQDCQVCTEIFHHHFVTEKYMLLTGDNSLGVYK